MANKLEAAIKLLKITQFLEKYKIENYTINDDLTVDVNGDVNLWAKGLTEIPIQFGKVTGNFWCNHNKLTSLKGCPKYVGGFFSCGSNNFTIIDYCPEYVGDAFDCDYAPISTLEGSPKFVCKEFSCMGNESLKSLKGIGEVKELVFTEFFMGYLKEYKGEL